MITAFNKKDRFEGEYAPRDFQAERTAFISAKTGEGVEELLSCVEDVLREQKVEIEQIYPYSDAGKIQLIRKYGELEKEEYTQEGIYVRAYVPVDVYGKLTHEPSGGR